MKIIFLGLLLTFIVWMGHGILFDRPTQKPAGQATAKRSQPVQQPQQQPQTSKVPRLAPDDSTVPDVNGAAVMAGLLTQTFQKQGSDVTVMDLDSHTMLFDCTKEFDPRTSCYVLYKTYPKNRDEKQMLRMMGVHSLKYKIKDGILQ